MSFRIHAAPAASAPACIIRVKHHQLPKERAMAQLEAEIEYEDEYEDELEQKAAPQPAAIPDHKPAPVQHQPHAPLPPVIAQPQVQPVPEDETFKLRRKRRV